MRVFRLDLSLSNFLFFLNISLLPWNFTKIRIVSMIPQEQRRWPNDCNKRQELLKTFTVTSITSKVLKISIFFFSPQIFEYELSFSLLNNFFFYNSDFQSDQDFDGLKTIVDKIAPCIFKETNIPLNFKLPVPKIFLKCFLTVIIVSWSLL